MSLDDMTSVELNEWVEKTSGAQKLRAEIERLRAALDKNNTRRKLSPDNAYSEEQLAIRCALAEAENERLRAALRACEDYVRHHHNASGWWNDRDAWNILHDVIEPALKPSDTK